jgi:hypothetical protein
MFHECIALRRAILELDEANARCDLSMKERWGRIATWVLEASSSSSSSSSQPLSSTDESSQPDEATASSSSHELNHYGKNSNISSRTSGHAGDSAAAYAAAWCTHGDQGKEYYILAHENHIRRLTLEVWAIHVLFS